jgi:hypothetical protein
LVLKAKLSIEVSISFIDCRITALAPAADGRHFLAGDEDGMLALREVTQPSEVSHVALQTPVADAALVPPGDTHALAALRDGRLAVVTLHFD